MITVKRAAGEPVRQRAHGWNPVEGGDRCQWCDACRTLMTFPGSHGPTWLFAVDGSSDWTEDEPVCPGANADGSPKKKKTEEGTNP